MRILFMGTPDIAASCLVALAEAGHEIIGAVTQADRPKGRGYTLTPPPVKVAAIERNIPVYQPATLRDEAFSALLAELDPAVIVVVAYGKILPASVLSYPKYGCINLHASLLPKYRGAAPIQRAIMDGESETGITAMYMDEGLDTGDILSVHPFPIGHEDTLGTVEERSAEIGGEALVAALTALEEGRAPRTPQKPEGASYAEKITKEDTRLSFSLPASALLAKIRGLAPAPLAVCRQEDGRALKILTAVAGEGADPFGVYPAPMPTGAPAGTVVALSDKGEGGITVACLDGTVTFKRVLPEGKGAMSAADLVRGRRIRLGELLS